MPKINSFFLLFSLIGLFSSCKSIKDGTVDSIEQYEVLVSNALYQMKNDSTLRAQYFALYIKQEKGIKFQIIPNEFLLSKSRNTASGFAIYISNQDQKEEVVKRLNKCDKNSKLFVPLDAHNENYPLINKGPLFQIYVASFGEEWQGVKTLSTCLLEPSKGNIKIEAQEN